MSYTGGFTDIGSQAACGVLTGIAYFLPTI